MDRDRLSRLRDAWVKDRGEYKAKARELMAAETALRSAEGDVDPNPVAYLSKVKTALVDVELAEAALKDAYTSLSRDFDEKVGPVDK